MTYGFVLLSIVILTAIFGCLWLFMNQNHRYHHTNSNRLHSSIVTFPDTANIIDSQRTYYNRLDNIFMQITDESPRNRTYNQNQYMHLETELNKQCDSMNILSSQINTNPKLTFTYTNQSKLAKINSDMSDMLIVFTTCNHIDITLQSLTSINKSFELSHELYYNNPSKPPHIVIIDDASTDETVPKLRTMGYTVITTITPKGLTFSWNLGYRIARMLHTYNFIVFMNNDVLIPRGSLEILYNSLSSHEIVCPVTTLKGAGQRPPQAVINNFPGYSFEFGNEFLSREAYESFVDNPLNTQSIQDSLLRMRQIRAIGDQFKANNSKDTADPSKVDFTIPSGVRRKTNKNKNGYFLYPKFNGFLFGVNIQRMVANQIPWDNYTFFDPSTVMVGQEDKLSTLLNRKGILPVIEPFSFMYHYKSVTVGKAKSLTSNQVSDKRDNLTHYHVDFQTGDGDGGLNKIEKQSSPFSNSDNINNENENPSICIGIRTYPHQKYWIQSLISTLLAQYDSLATYNYKDFISMNVYVINTEPLDTLYNQYLSKITKTMNSEWSTANSTVNLLTDVSNTNCNYTKSTRNAFYGYDMTDSMLQTMISNSKCEWLMFTNGDNVYNRAWLSSIVDKMLSSIGSNSKNACTHISNVTDIIGWDFVTHHPRRIKTNKGNMIQRTQQVISIQMKRRFVDLGSVIVRKSLFQQQHTRQFTLVPKPNEQNQSSISMELLYNEVRFMPDAIFTTDMFARDYYTIRTLISISNSNLVQCIPITDNENLNNSGIHLIHQTLLFHQ